MAGKDSTQHWLDRNRPPRVQITYDVETGGASEKKELPMVMGIMADLSGNDDAKRAKMKDRKFVEIDRDNFDAVMKQISPRLQFKVGDKDFDLKLEKMEHFSPAHLVKEFEPLEELYRRRTALNDLLAKLDGNDELEEALRKVITDGDNLKALKADLEAEVKKLPAPDA